MRCVVSVLGPDRSGIVADVAGALAKFNANIEDISQTVLDGVFSMTMIVTLDLEKATFNDTQESLRSVAQDLNVQIVLQREDVVKFMYEV